MIEITKRINIRIFPDGKIQADIQGIKGKKCTDYLEVIQEILQARIEDSDYTKEYYEKETEENVHIDPKIEEITEENLDAKEIIRK